MIRHILLVGFAYYVGAWFGANYTITESGIVIFWPPNAVLLTAFLLLPLRQWPGVALAALGAEILVDVPAFPLWSAISFGVINVGEAALAACLISRLVQQDFSFNRIRSVSSFLVAGPLVASSIAALFGALVYTLLDRDDSTYMTLWRLWWFGDALGLLLLTPLLLSGVRFVQAGHFDVVWSRLLEFLLLLAATGLLTPLVVGEPDPAASGFYFTPLILLPLCLWAAIRFGIEGTVIAIALIAVAVTYQVTNGARLYGASDPQFVVWLAQELLAILAVTSIGLTVMLNELRFKNNVLESRIRNRTASLEEVNRALNDANSRLEEMAASDFLMGISNRRDFTRTADRLLQRLQGAQVPVSLIMFDLDHFKSVNDKYGHDAGDKLLQNLVEPVQLTIRPADLFARYGGEEFLILLSEANQDAAAMIAERLRVAIASRLTIHGEHRIRVTSSFGVAQWDGQSSLAELVSQADSALYKAKQTGRNKVCTA